MGKLKHRAAEEVAYAHMASKWQSQDSNSGHLTQGPILLLFALDQELANFLKGPDGQYFRFCSAAGKIDILWRYFCTPLKWDHLKTQKPSLAQSFIKMGGKLDLGDPAQYWLQPLGPRVKSWDPAPTPKVRNIWPSSALYLTVESKPARGSRDLRDPMA